MSRSVNQLFAVAVAMLLRAPVAAFASVISLQPGSQDVDTGQTASYDVVVSDGPETIAGFGLELNVGSTDLTPSAQAVAQVGLSGTTAVVGNTLSLSYTFDGVVVPAFGLVTLATVDPLNNGINEGESVLLALTLLLVESSGVTSQFAAQIQVQNTALTDLIVPEPSTGSMMALAGLLWWLFLRWRGAAVASAPRRPWADSWGGRPLRRGGGLAVRGPRRRPRAAPS